MASEFINNRAPLAMTGAGIGAMAIPGLLEGQPEEQY
jgi:hypothetical protein